MSLASIADVLVVVACMALVQQAHAEGVPRPVHAVVLDVEAVVAAARLAVEALLEEVAEEVVVVEEVAADAVEVEVSLLDYQVVYGKLRA